MVTVAVDAAEFRVWVGADSVGGMLFFFLSGEARFGKSCDEYVSPRIVRLMNPSRAEPHFFDLDAGKRAER